MVHFSLMNRFRPIRPVRTITALAVLAVMVGAPVGCETLPDTPTVTLQRDGDHEFEWGRYESASAYYQQILKREPGDPEALEMNGRCLLELGRPQEAAEDFSIAVARQPGDRMLLLLLAKARFESGEFDEAFDLVRTWAVDNNDSVAWMTLAGFARESNDPDTAREAVLRAIETDPEGSADAYILAAEIEMDLGESTTALRRLRQAYGLEPGNLDIAERLRAYGEIPGPTLVLPPGP
jgi:tetratricopeptide (TPR) repeat protein